MNNEDFLGIFCFVSYSFCLIFCGVNRSLKVLVKAASPGDSFLEAELSRIKQTKKAVQTENPVHSYVSFMVP